MVPLVDDTGRRRRRNRSESFSLLITNSGTPITKIPHTDERRDEAIAVAVVAAVVALPSDTDTAHCCCSVTPFKLASTEFCQPEFGRDATSNAATNGLPSLYVRNGEQHTLIRLVFNYSLHVQNCDVDDDYY